MDPSRQKRIIEKLRRLADPSRNPNAEEVSAASAKLEELLLRERMETEEMEFRVLLDLQRVPPTSWETGLYSFICCENACKGIYTVTENGLHLLKAAGRPARLKKAELQYLWAHGRIKDATRNLPANTSAEYRESYEKGATRELVKIMQEVCEGGTNEEAETWLKEQIKINKEPETKSRVIDPYWSEGRKALRKAFSDKSVAE